MRSRLTQWFIPPDRGHPAETLRWVRRVSLLISAFGLIVAGQAALEGADKVVVWVLVASAVLLASTWLTLKPAIRHAERRGPLTVEERTRAIRRSDRGTLVMAAIYCVTFPIVGYVLEGTGGAIFFFVLGGAGAGLGVRTSRNLRRRGR